MRDWVSEASGSGRGAPRARPEGDAENQVLQNKAAKWATEYRRITNVDPRTNGCGYWRAKRRRTYPGLIGRAQADIPTYAHAEDREVLVQVKTVAHRTAQSVIELAQDDVAGIAAMGRRGGWFAVLDCAVPVQWIMVAGTRAASLLGKPMYLATLRANRNTEMSTECNEHFFEMIAANRSRLPNLRYTVLRRRALARDGL